MEKYSKDAPFADPVLRCNSCKNLVRVEYLRKNGSCPCGGRRMLEVRTLTGEEANKLRKEFPDFVDVFKVVPDVEEGIL